MNAPYWSHYIGSYQDLFSLGFQLQPGSRSVSHKCTIELSLDARHHPKYLKFVSLMTKAPSSTFSFVEPTSCDDIASTFAELREVISREAALRKTLDELFVKKKEDAEEALRKAQMHLKRVKTEELEMCAVLKAESAAASEVGNHSSLEKMAKIS